MSEKKLDWLLNSFLLLASEQISFPSFPPTSDSSVSFLILSCFPLLSHTRERFNDALERADESLLFILHKQHELTVGLTVDEGGEVRGEGRKHNRARLVECVRRNLSRKLTERKG